MNAFLNLGKTHSAALVLCSSDRMNSTSPENAFGYLDRLLSLGPAKLKSWLESSEADNKKAREGLNLLGLAQAAALRARTDLDLEWAEVSGMLYKKLASSACTQERDALLLDMMNLRAFFIKRMGTNRKSPILEFDDLATWFLGNLPVSLEEAKEKCGRLEQLHIEDIRALRQVKNRLAAFKELEQFSWIDAYPEIKEWLAIRQKLP